MKHRPQIGGRSIGMPMDLPQCCAALWQLQWPELPMQGCKLGYGYN